MHPRQLLLIAFVGLMVASAGCAGFGMDSLPIKTRTLTRKTYKALQMD